MSIRREFVATMVVLFAAWAANSAKAAPIIDDAVFAHDFEQVSGATITALRGPNATINSQSIVPSTYYPKSGSKQHITPTYSGNGRAEYVNMISQLITATEELSYTIFYNDQGDDGGDHVNSISSAILLSATDYSKTGNNFWFGTTKYVPGVENPGADRHLWFGYSGAVIAVISTEKTPSADSLWHQAGFVYQGGQTDGTVTFYFDGQQLGGPVTIKGVPEIGALVAPWTLIEDYEPYRSISGDEYFDNGFYDEAALWTRALSAGDMKALYEQGINANAVPEPCTLIVWSLLGASGVTLGWWRRRKRAG